MAIIFIHSDDYGVSEASEATILSCITDGAVNSVSVMANTARLENSAHKLKEVNKNIRIALHLDLTEGKCVENPENLFLLTDKDGYFKHGFISLWLKYIFASKKNKAELKKQVHLEFAAQARVLKKYINFNAVDSHCHMHMIPFVFDIASDIARQENASVRLVREPSLPFIKHISLLITYKPANILKHVLLNMLSAFASRKCKNKLYLFGVMFSGKMNLARVKKILPEMINIAERENANLEVLFHPCPLGTGEKVDSKNNKFEKYYKSEGRLLEVETVNSNFLKNIVSR
ncbi:MAG: ChbG/HpnK family deacetylase [Elusimicrobia bacterium]|nr:ChbG/HpnK family deacetylase [Elusimicrobiota bacterium]